MEKATGRERSRKYGGDGYQQKRSLIAKKQTRKEVREIREVNVDLGKKQGPSRRHIKIYEEGRKEEKKGEKKGGERRRRERIGRRNRKERKETRSRSSAKKKWIAPEKNEAGKSIANIRERGKDSWSQEERRHKKKEKRHAAKNTAVR